MGVLLVLLIPIGFLAGIVTSRESYKEEAVNNISTSWAGVQKINAPTLSLNIPVKDNSMYQHLKPQDYNTNVNIQTELRKKEFLPFRFILLKLQLKEILKIRQEY